MATGVQNVNRIRADEVLTRHRFVSLVKGIPEAIGRGELNDAALSLLKTIYEKAVGDDGSIRIEVMEGTLELETNEGVYVVPAGKRLTISTDGKTLRLSHIDPAG